MSEVQAQLEQSAFLASVDNRDRNFWRFAGGLSVGAVGGLAAGLVCGGIALGIFALGSGLAAGDPASFLRQAIQMIQADGANLTSALLLLTLAVATNCPMAAAFTGICALFARRHVMDYITAAARVRWRLLLAGLGLSVLFIGPLLLAGQLTDPKAPMPPMLHLAADLPTRGLYVVTCIGLLIPAAAAEELVFRGWLLRQTSAVTRNAAVLMVVNGLLFSAVHFEFAPDAFLMRAIMGAGFVYMTLRLGGIEFSTGAHAANNILIVLFIEPLTLRPNPTPGIGVGSLAEDIYLFTAYIVMAEITARWAPLRRWTGAQETLARPAIIGTGPWSVFE